MNENKTKPTDTSVDAFLSDLNDQRREESRVLIKMMQEVTGEPPVMWGSNIIGFGKIHYKYASGREGDWMQLGFSPRKAKISLYITGEAEQYTPLLDKMGKYSIGKGCIYINKLADVDLDKLHKLIETAYKNCDQC